MKEEEPHLLARHGVGSRNVPQPRQLRVDADGRLYEVRARSAAHFGERAPSEGKRAGGVHTAAGLHNRLGARKAGTRGAFGAVLCRGSLEGGVSARGGSQRICARLTAKYLRECVWT
jgi:hypothetical protein